MRENTQNTVHEAENGDKPNRNDGTQVGCPFAHRKCANTAIETARDGRSGGRTRGLSSHHG